MQENALAFPNFQKSRGKNNYEILDNNLLELKELGTGGNFSFLIIYVESSSDRSLKFTVNLVTALIILPKSINVS